MNKPREWFEYIKKLSRGVRLLGIVSMDDWNPPRFWARVFILDSRDFYTGGSLDYLPRRDAENYAIELNRVKSWSDLTESYYFDHALSNYIYANDPEEGSRTMAEAISSLRRTMTAIKKGYNAGEP